MTSHELRTRLLLRIGDPLFVRSVHATNDGLATLGARAVDAGPMHDAETADALLDCARAALGDLGFELEERLRDGVRRGVPRPALVYLAASQAPAARHGRVRVRGVWTRHSIAELLALGDHAFAAELYRTLLWRDATEREMENVAARLAAGATRHDIIASVAALPAARDTPVPLEGIVDVDALLHGSDDGEFIDRLYTTLLGRAPEPDGARTWRAALRAGVRRDELVRRFIRQAASSFPNRVYLGGERGRTPS